ncbi:hypothetical protein EON73_00025 [bacterium]|nr:MAG: hypothetical protein EON73_00025 [bacterium]
MLKNIIANIIGRFWSILSNYLFIPLYISFLGIENYAIISFSFILVGIMSVLDAGLTATLSREFAKHDDSNFTNYKMRTLNTLELCYWCIVIIILLIVLIFAGPIAEKWITLKDTSVTYIANALKIFGAGMALQLLGNFYIGGLIGLEQQIKANVYQMVWGVFRNGIVLIIIFFKPSLIYFFAWQAFVTLVYVVYLRYTLVSSIKKTMTQPSKGFLFDKNLLFTIGNFVGGMLLISIVAAINTQLDKIAISKMLPIKELGYYNLGISLTQVILVLVSPISIALLPRFTSLYSLKQHKEASTLFYTILLFVSIIVFSLTANIIFNSTELILAWTGNVRLAISSSKYVLFLATGTAMLSMQIIPFNIAIANGYTKINNIIGISSLLISIPGYLFSVYYFGSKGAAVTWCIIQTAITPIYLFYIHRKFLKEYTYSSLMFKQVYKPALAALLIAFLLNRIIPNFNNRILQLMIISLSILITLISVTFITIPVTRINFYWLIIKGKLDKIFLKLKLNQK